MSCDIVGTKMMFLKIGIGLKITSKNAYTSAPGSILQSDFKTPDRYGTLHGTFEVFSLEGSEMIWYRLQGNRESWERVPLSVTNGASSMCSCIQSDFKANWNLNEHNLELVVLEGNELVHYWHDNFDFNSPWHKNPQVITNDVIGQPCLIQTDFMSLDTVHNVWHKMMLVVIIERNGTLAFYRHLWDDGQRDWEWKRLNFPFITNKAKAASIIHSL
jgi:hypothetical protein